METRCRRLWSSVFLASLAIGPLSAQVPTPSVNIDAPSVGSVISGTVTVSGWALDNVDTDLGTALSSVAIEVDGNTVGNATMGISRPDVCQIYPSRPMCPNVGWAYTLNAAALSAGTHTITAVATDENTPPTTGSASVTVSVVGTGAAGGSSGSAGSSAAGGSGGSTEPWVNIDSPTAGSAVTGTITVSGWTLDTMAGGTPISFVQVFVDGAYVGDASYGVSRPDVCASFPGPNCPNVGYTFLLNTGNYAQGSHVVTVTAIDSSSPPLTNSASASFTVNAPSPSGLDVYIDSPTNGTVLHGMVNVDGWAIGPPNGFGIALVQILVDGQPNGYATYGANRPDVCAAYPGRPACPNVGFTYQLQTSLLSLGTHTLTATAASIDNPQMPTSWTINFTVSSNMTVNIENPTQSSSVSGYVIVSGWALEAGSSGVPISMVQVSVDGVLNGTAYYGLGQPSACTTYPNSPGCPNVGYFYYLNMSPYQAGNHTITVTATDSSSTPNTASASVIVNVP